MKLFGRRVGDRQEQVHDQREYERIRMVLGVVCRQSAEDFHIFTDDVSGNGLRFISQVRVKPEESLVLFLPVNREGARILVKARVAWTREEGERQYVGGVAFQDMTEANRKRWLDFVEANRQALPPPTRPGGNGSTPSG